LGSGSDLGVPVARRTGHLPRRIGCEEVHVGVDVGPVGVQGDAGDDVAGGELVFRAQAVACLASSPRLTDVLSRRPVSNERTETSWPATSARRAPTVHCPRGRRI